MRTELSLFHRMVRSAFTWVISLHDIGHVADKGNLLLARGEMELKDVFGTLAFKRTHDLSRNFFPRESAAAFLN